MNRDAFVAHFSAPWVVRITDPECSSGKAQVLIKEMTTELGLDLTEILVCIQRCVNGKPN